MHTCVTIRVPFSPWAVVGRVTNNTFFVELTVLKYYPILVLYCFPPKTFPNIIICRILTFLVFGSRTVKLSKWIEQNNYWHSFRVNSQISFSLFTPDRLTRLCRMKPNDTEQNYITLILFCIETTICSIMLL